MGGKRKRRVTNVTNLTKQNISACNKMAFDFIKTHELQGLRVCVERSFNLAPFFSLLFFFPLSSNSYSFLSARVKKKKEAATSRALQKHRYSPLLHFFVTVQLAKTSHPYKRQAKSALPKNEQKKKIGCVDVQHTEKNI